MNAVDDEAGAQAIVGKLVPNVVGMAAKDGMSAVAEVRRQGGSGAHGVIDLFCSGAGVSNADGDAVGHQSLDVARGFGPVGRDGHEADESMGRVAPESPFIEVGRADPLAGMRAAGSIVGSDIGSFDVDAFDQGGFRDLLLGAPRSEEHTSELQSPMYLV